MENNKFNIDYNNFNPEKEYVINNEKAKLSNNKIIGIQKGGEITGNLNKESGYMSDLGSRTGSTNLKNWLSLNEEAATIQRIENGNKVGKINKENGHMSNVGKQYGPINGTKFRQENPKEAKIIQRKATAAAVLNKKLMMEERYINFYNTIETSDWFSLSDVERIVIDLGYQSTGAWHLIEKNPRMYEKTKGKVLGTNGKLKSGNLYKKRETLS